MTTNQMKRALTRFRQLAVMEAFGTIAEKDEGKLNRYQALLRLPLTPMEKRNRSRMEYQTRIAIKMARALSMQKPIPQKSIDLINSKFWELV